MCLWALARFSAHLFIDWFSNKMSTRRAPKQFFLWVFKRRARGDTNMLHNKQVGGKEDACPVMPSTDNCIRSSCIVKWLLVISGVPFQVLMVNPSMYERTL